MFDNDGLKSFATYSFNQLIQHRLCKMAVNLNYSELPAVNVGL